MTKEEIIDVIHKTMYQFFDVCGDNEEVPMSDKDELLLSVNKAICNNIKALEESCEDAVSRKAIVEMLNARGQGSVMTFDNFIELLYKLPSVTPTRKRGKWIRKPIRNTKGGCVGAEMICTCCGKDNNCDKKLNYCPNCGAEMEVEK